MAIYRREKVLCVMLENAVNAHINFERIHHNTDVPWFDFLKMCSVEVRAKVNFDKSFPNLVLQWLTGWQPHPFLLFFHQPYESDKYSSSEDGELFHHGTEWVSHHLWGYTKRAWVKNLLHIC